MGLTPTLVSEMRAKQSRAGRASGQAADSVSKAPHLPSRPVTQSEPVLATSLACNVRGSREREEQQLPEAASKVLVGDRAWRRARTVWRGGKESMDPQTSEC